MRSQSWLAFFIIVSFDFRLFGYNAARKTHRSTLGSHRFGSDSSGRDEPCLAGHGPMNIMQHSGAAVIVR